MVALRVRKQTIVVTSIAIGLLIMALGIGRFLMSRAQFLVDPTDAPVLVTVSETIRPGETVNIQGGRLSVHATAWIAPIASDGSQGTKRQMTIRNQSDLLIQAIVPSDMTGDLWAVWVQNGSVTSNTKYINQARVNAIDTWDDLPPSWPIKVYGRNLVYRNLTYSDAVATFVSDTQNLTGTVTGGDENSLSITTPAGITAGKTYTLKISNGLGGSTGFSTAPFSWTGKAAVTDPFNLRVPWGNDLVASAANVYNVKTDVRMTLHAVGDGVADDLPALKEAAAKAYSDGGGVVYLPAGTYRIDNSVAAGAWEIRDKVVLRGEDKDTTTIEFGESSEADSRAVTITGTSAGILDLGFENINPDPEVKNLSVVLNEWSSANQKVFFQGNKFVGHVNRGISAYQISNIVIQDNELDFRFTDSLSSYATIDTLAIHDNSKVTVRNNTVNYSLTRVHISDNDDVIIEGNTFDREGYQSSVCKAESGGLEMGFSERIVVKGNTIQTTGDVDRDQVCNDNEALMSQFSIYHMTFFGSVTSASGTTVVDATKNWDTADFTNARTPLVIFITSGKGKGQWRHVTGYSGGSLTVDRAWDYPLAVGDTYFLRGWNLLAGTFTDNTISSGNICILIYSGGGDLAVQRNTCTNSGFIWLQGEDTYRDPDPQGNIVENDKLWNAYVEGNSNTNTTDRKPSAYFITTRMWDTGNSPSNGYWDNGTRPLDVMGVELRRNSLTAHSPNTTWGAGYAPTERYYIYQFIGGSPVTHPDPNGMVGIITEGNTSSNISAYPYVYNLGTSQNTLTYSGAPDMSLCFKATTSQGAVAQVNGQLRFTTTGGVLKGRTEYQKVAADGTITVDDPTLYSALQQGNLSNGTTYDVRATSNGNVAQVTRLTSLFTGCPTVVTSKLIFGDVVGDDNAVTNSDLDMLIRIYRGDDDSTVRATGGALGAPPTLSNLVTVIRTLQGGTP